MREQAMDTFFGKTYGALTFAAAVVKFAFCVPLYSDNAFGNRVSRFRRKAALA
jgi:hypothetical protein